MPLCNIVVRLELMIICCYFECCCFLVRNQLSQVYHVKRNNATDKSFEGKNTQYLSHPKSSVPSHGFDKIDNIFQKRLEDSKSVIRKEIKAEVLESSHQFHQPYPSHSTSQIAFLTKEELEVANENAQRRCAEILNGDPIPSSIRPDVSKAEERDSGLAWLYESPITFVDSSKDVSDEVRILFMLISQ